MTTVVLVGTLDTKGIEYGFLRDRLREAGVDVVLVDAGVLGEPLVEPDVTREFPNLRWHHDPNSDGTPEQVEENRRTLRHLQDWLADYEKEHGPIAPPAAGAGRVKPELAARIDGLVGRLGSDRYAEREAAGKELEEVGEDALPALDKATCSQDAEVRRRASKLVNLR